MNIISFLSPINLAEEKARFFESTTYHPQLRYTWETPEVVAWVHKQTEYQPLLQALLQQDSGEIRAQAELIFDTALHDQYLTQAKEILKESPQPIAPQPLENIVEAFQQAFTFFELHDFALEVVDQHGFNFRPLAAEKKIVMSKHLNLDFFSVDGEVKHELVHILRYINGQHNSVPIDPQYLPTEEGMATYYQDYAGEDGHASLFQHAAEYAMTEISLKTSLRETIEYLIELGFSRELAWQRAVRHKFGFQDTAQAGDIMKPSMYFFHQQKIKALTSDERLRLFSGKISQKQLPEYQDYTGIIPKEKLQVFYERTLN